MNQELDLDQKLIIGVYNLYSNESDLTYLQYTAACAIFYYLTSKELFNYNLDSPLVYDYLYKRRYIWEDKKFMSDINIARDSNYLIRARATSKTSRDVNGHQCSNLGKKYVLELLKTDQTFNLKMKEIEQLLHFKDILMQVKIKENNPELNAISSRGKVVRRIPITGFLKDSHSIEANQKEVSLRIKNIEYSSYFLENHD